MTGLFSAQRRADEFEALLLEVLGEGSVTVPELGTFTAVHPPIVVLTSNRSRDLHNALLQMSKTKIRYKTARQIYVNKSHGSVKKIFSKRFLNYFKNIISKFSYKLFPSRLLTINYI